MVAARAVVWADCVTLGDEKVRVGVRGIVADVDPDEKDVVVLLPWEAASVCAFPAKIAEDEKIVV